MGITDHEWLLIVNAHIINFIDINGKVMITFKWSQKLLKLLTDVFQCIILLYPLVKFAFDLLGVSVPSFINLFVFFLFVIVNHSTTLLHSQLMFKIIVHKFLNCVAFSHFIISHLHLSLCFSSGHVVFWNFLFICTLIFIHIKLLSDIKNNILE